MKVVDHILEKLISALHPVRLDVIDESHRHAGHAGSRPGGETHFRVEIVSGAFEARSRVERQRPVHEILAAELAEQVHALSIKALTPEESTSL